MTFLPDGALVFWGDHSLTVVVLCWVCELVHVDLGAVAFS